MSNELFSIDEIEQRAESLKGEERWYAFNGKAFGDQSPLPLKVKLKTGGEDWNRGWTKGMQSYAKTLPAGAKKRFNQNASNPMTIDSDALVAANRSAIRAGNVIVAIAVVGPVIEFIDAPLAEDLQKRFGSEMLPEEFRSFYERRADGFYEIPLQTEPPPQLVLTNEQVQRLLKFPDFVNQIAEFRRLLVDEDVENEEEELGNSGSGSARAAHGRS